MKTAIAAVMALGLAIPAGAQTLSNPDSDFVDTTSKKAWHSTVEKTDRGYLIGNPDAKVRLVMFTAYSCEGCEAFAYRGDPELDHALLAPGLLNIEIRPRFAHPADLPLALLATCGNPAQFKVNHAMLMRDRKRWMAEWNRASGFNRQAWSRDNPQARTSLVSALGFDDLMARRRGYSRMDLTRCLGDRKATASLLASARMDDAEYALPTDAQGYAQPHFLLNGEKLDGVHDWPALYDLLKNRFRPKPKPRLGEQP